MFDIIKELAQKYASELIQVRRYLHQNPELSYQEFETSKFIQNYLGAEQAADFRRFVPWHVEHVK